MVGDGGPAVVATVARRHAAATVVAVAATDRFTTRTGDVG